MILFTLPIYAHGGEFKTIEDTFRNWKTFKRPSKRIVTIEETCKNPNKFKRSKPIRKMGQTKEELKTFKRPNNIVTIEELFTEIRKKNEKLKEAQKQHCLSEDSPKEDPFKKVVPKEDPPQEPKVKNCRAWNN